MPIFELSLGRKLPIPEYWMHIENTYSMRVIFCDQIKAHKARDRIFEAPGQRLRSFISGGVFSLYREKKHKLRSATKKRSYLLMRKPVSFCGTGTYPS